MLINTVCKLYIRMIDGDVCVYERPGVDNQNDSREFESQLKFIVIW